MVAAELMTAAPQTIDARATVEEAARLMRANDVRHLPVVSADELVGMISDRDLAALLYEDLMNTDPEETGTRLHSRIADVMSGHVLTVGRETTIEEIIDLFVEHKVGALPVIDETGEGIVGIISYIDILRAAAEQF